MNKLIITGNLVRDPELRSTKDGIAVCSFTVAVNRRKKGAEAGQDADFFRVTAWRGLAEICGKHLAKGRKVGVTGSVTVSTYQANDGTTRANMEVTADDVEFLSPREFAAGTVGAIDQEQKAGQYITVDDNELPF